MGLNIYGQDGQRSNKYTQNSETLYFNKMWTLHTDSGNNVYGGQTAKNIYLGDTRIVTKLNSGDEPTYNEEYYKQYYYHSDHLGSATLISDYKGDEYQRIEYTPYGETWVEKTQNTGLEYLPYKFTGKEIDEETGLYYYGARYLDPRYSRWLSTDPALGNYIPSTGKATASDAGSLPGMGGVFNTVNFQLYHYAGNNPVKYTDPDGQAIHILVGAGIGVAIGAVSALCAGGSARQVAAAAVGGAVSGAMAAVTCGASLGGQIAGSAMAGAAGYCAEKMVSGESATVEGMVNSAASGAAGAMVGTIANKSVSTVSAKISSSVPKLKNGDTVYRVYGCDSSAEGASWTTANPGKVQNYRNQAGLPSGGESGVVNSGQFVIQGTVKDSSKCVLSRKALPLDGNNGGLNEYIIPNAVQSGAVKVTNVSGVNPEF